MVATDKLMAGKHGASVTRYLSFDVGIRHLAYCVLQHPLSRGACVGADTEVVEWDVIDLGPVPCVEACAQGLMEALEARFGGGKFVADVVLIERQPRSRSIIMVAVQMLLCGYFSLAKVHGRVGRVRFVSAARKLDMKLEGPSSALVASAEAGRRKYAANKAYAIATARRYLEHVLVDFANLALLDAYTKKDDMCDALLQALSVIEGCGATSTPPAFRRRRRSKRS